MAYIYSASSNQFFPKSLKSNYEQAGTWPSDAVDVSNDTFRHYAIDAPPDGMQRIAGSDGFPSWSCIPDASPEERRSTATDRLDATADDARSRDQSIGQLLDIEYQQVIEAHGRWYANGYDETKCPDEIKAWADAEGVTPLQAAQEIAEAAAHREEVIRQIRTIRLAGKAAVRAAADDADFTAIAEPYIHRLNHIDKLTTNI